MQYAQCRCGNMKHWGSGMMPAPCLVCSKCGSTYGYGPDNHLEQEPHEFKTQYNQNTGEPYEICTKCMRRKSEIDKPSELA